MRSSILDLAKANANAVLNSQSEEKKQPQQLQRQIQQQFLLQLQAPGNNYAQRQQQLQQPQLQLQQIPQSQYHFHLLRNTHLQPQRQLLQLLQLQQPIYPTMKSEKSDIERDEEIIKMISVLKEQIQNGRNINERDNFGQTLLIHSIINENYQLTKALLRLEQVDVNAVDHMNNSALHYASSKGNVDIIKAFAERKDVNFNAFAGNNNATALQIGAKNGFDEVVQALIDANASVDICNSDKNTALHVAVFFGKEKVVEVLLKAGADLDMRDNKNNTALDIAKNIIEDEIKRDRMIKLLTANKVDLKKSDSLSPEKNRKRKFHYDLNDNPTNNLQIASLECNFEKVKELLEKGADPNWTAIKGGLPPITLVALSDAKKGDYEKIKIIALLYQYGADIDTKYFDDLFKDNVITENFKKNIDKLVKYSRDFDFEKFLKEIINNKNLDKKDPAISCSFDDEAVNNLLYLKNKIPPTHTGYDADESCSSSPSPSPSPNHQESYLIKGGEKKEGRAKN